MANTGQLLQERLHAGHKVVGLCHCTTERGGVDVPAVFEKHGGKLRLVHLAPFKLEPGGGVLSVEELLKGEAEKRCHVLVKGVDDHRVLGVGRAASNACHFGSGRIP